MRFEGIRSSGFLSVGLGLVISGRIMFEVRAFGLFEFWPRFGHFWANYVRSSGLLGDLSEVRVWMEM